MKGLKSPHGHRGAVCAHFGWSLDYLLHGIPWAIVKRMMVDAPAYDPDGGKDDEVKLTSENQEQILNYVNNLM